MNQDVNRRGLVATEKGPVWNIRVGIFSPSLFTPGTEVKETKLWKIKVILN